MVKEDFTDKVLSERHLKEVVAVYIPEEEDSRPREEQGPGPRSLTVAGIFEGDALL